MAIVTISVHCRVKHWWLIKAINYPLLALGLEAWIPSICIEAKVVSDAA